MSEAPFRILSLDGGGIRGLFSAAFLAHVENYTGKSLADHFDLIVGTSTGAIIALGLASGRSADDILHFYQQYGRSIFAKPDPLRGLLRPKHGTERLSAALRAILGDTTLNELHVPVCVPSYELVEGWPRVFKDDHHPSLHWGGDQEAWKVAAASSAAPIYFPSFQVGSADSYVDGGIWANNPVLVGITEALKYFGRALDDVSILSVGTGSRPLRLEHGKAKSRGLLQWGWNGRIVGLVFDAQAQAAHSIAQVLLTSDRYLRVDVDLPVPVALDRFESAVHLMERGAQAGRMRKAEVEQRFLAWPRTINRSGNGPRSRTR